MITPTQQRAIEQAHAAGLNNPEIAAQTGLSVSTVKRYRAKSNLGGNGLVQQLARFGVQHVTDTARQLGLTVEMPASGARHDLLIQGRRVDVKAAGMVLSPAQTPSPRWQFWFKSSRREEMEEYDYALDQWRDAEVVICVCCPQVPYRPVAYLYEAYQLPKTLTFGRHGVHDYAHERWGLLGSVRA
ncbi:sigma-70 region 4 domain-containing protein [Deinococcus koreensis]|uniref:Uncharacterized protein n=1 Tax=Deinococcus koreensis TaxID=2054903 RepID=A0A2K3UYQ0_9DEIO|nr:sigma-70 region 4 domain-containing protein [Deinococcus koreensis]PNY81658.1 hypothetical protein CVO96_09990 [Deinococcus koreensis]